MALIKCPECGQMISEYADRCISCGCPMEMIKKLLVPQHAEFAIKKDGFISKLSEAEQKFILLLIDYASSLKFKVVEYNQFISFRSNDKEYISFWIVRPSAGLTYGYVDENDKKHKIKIKSADPKWLISQIKHLDIQNNSHSIQTEEQTVDKQGEKDSEKDLFLEKVSEDERKFINYYKNILNDRYKGIFKFRSYNNYWGARNRELGKYLFVFKRSEEKLVFGYKKLTADSYDFKVIDDINSETLRDLLKISFEIMEPARNNAEFVNKDNRPVTNDEQIEYVDAYDVQKANKEPRILSFIRLEMMGGKYNSSPSIKALCKSIKKYLLDSFNNNVKTSKFYDIVFASTVTTFFGHHLAWNKNEGIRSAKIVYSYFKAQTIISKIKDYEEIFKKENQIVTDYSTLLDYLFKDIYSGKEINYQKAPGLSSDFSLVPEEVLVEILNNFEAYEND